MARIRAPTPIGYRGPFKNMEDIWRQYRNTPMYAGPYRAYFGKSKQPLSEYAPKVQYSGEHRPREPERKEQRIETNAVRNIETKNEIAKTEPSQKIETAKENATSQKIEKQNELSNEKSGSPYSYEIKAERTDIMTRKRPANYYDRAETGW